MIYSFFAFQIECFLIYYEEELFNGLCFERHEKAGMKMQFNMKNFKNAITTIAALAAMILIQGCAAIVVGGVVAGSTYGTVKYVSNTLQATVDAPLDKVWKAANDTVKELHMPVLTSKKDGMGGKLETRNVQGQKVVIQTIRKAENATEIDITVGNFDSDSNRANEQLIYDKMRARWE